MERSGRNRILWTLAVFAASLTVLVSGCEPGGSGPQVCHRSSDGSSLEIISVASEAELAKHLKHGDVFGTALDERCSGGVRFRVDPDIELSTMEVPGLLGGPPRQVAALVDERGGRDEFVANEVEVRFETRAELEDFLTLYDGTVLRDDTAFVIGNHGEPTEVPGGLDGWFLIQIEPSTSGLHDLPALAANAGIEGSLSASSEAALRTFAVHLREQSQGASANFVARPDALLEHPEVDPETLPWGEAQIDMSQQWWMTHDEDPSTPGDQGLSVSLARAFEYLRHTGYPPQTGAWSPARVAILDVGFDLDEQSGIGNPDYGSSSDVAPLQVDLIDQDETAGGSANGDLPWHGQDAFGVACARPNNLFGGAGTGGEFVRPLLVKMSMTSAGAAEAVRAAALMGASVINMSFGWYCANMCPRSTPRMEAAIRDAVFEHGVAVFASAGNGINNDGTLDVNVDGIRKLPCDVYGVSCVGAVNSKGENVWNWGDAVDIWAPTETRSTVSPDSAAIDDDDWGLDEVRIFPGTSAASPFVAGIAGMIKSVAPESSGFHIEQVLQHSANQSADPMVLTGYVDALRAVQTVRPNPPPTVRLAFLNTNATYSPVRNHELSAHLADEANPNGFIGKVEFYSDLDGFLCSQEGDANFMSCTGRFVAQGPHLITAVATDEFGATATSEGVVITVQNRAPSVELVTPADQATYYADQQLSFRALVHDADEEDFSAFCPVADSEACTEWRSNVDGVLTSTNPTENALSFSTALSQGTHTVTVTAWDQFGESASESITVTVEPGRGKPTARILTPLDELTWGEPIALRGNGVDPEDGLIAGSSYQWYSSVDGFLGTGAYLSVELTAPECEGGLEHVITLRVTDRDGNVGIDQIRVFFDRVC